MDEEVPSPLDSPPPPLPQVQNSTSKRKVLIFAIIGIIVLAAIVTIIIFMLQKKPAVTHKKVTSVSSQASQPSVLVDRLGKLDPCSLLSGDTLTQNALSIDQAGTVGLDDHDYPHCVWQSVVSNQLQYEIEATIAIGKDTDIFTPAPTPIGGQSKVGNHQTYLTLGDFGNGHGTCSFNVEITSNARVELEARDLDNTFEGGCSLANQYGPSLERSLTAKGF
jgi:hypothetical protein